jgi:hypothetical protein
MFAATAAGASAAFDLHTVIGNLSALFFEVD